MSVIGVWTVLVGLRVPANFDTDVTIVWFLSAIVRMMALF
jgi:hypothetical protein